MIPEVSVIIPCHNGAHHIGDALRSVLAQTPGDLEAIVVDDGSTDDTAAVVRGFDDPRVRYAPMPERRGNYFARNHGVALARGALLALLDADDLWAPRKLERQLGGLREHPECGASFADHLLFVDGRPDRRYRDLINTYAGDGRDRDGFLRRLLEGNFLVTSSAVIRRRSLDRVGVFDTAFQNAMDYDMWLRLAFDSPCHYVPEPLVLKRIHPGNISRNRVGSLQAVAYVFDKLAMEPERYPALTSELQPVAAARREQLRYRLGLEYLDARDFDNAARCLEASRPPHRSAFRRVALVAARTRSEPLVRAIHAFRAVRERRSRRPAVEAPGGR